MAVRAHDHAGLAIALILGGVFCISLNDLAMKQLSGAYPLHQSVFLRSAIGIVLSLVLVQIEGGWRILRTHQPGWHLLRGMLIVIANMTYFAALAALPLADATALFFAAPLFITLLSVPILKESVGPLRLMAVVVGFAGVIIMQRPWADSSQIDTPRLVMLLPVLAALAYAFNQLLTRRLGVTARASAMAVYIQATFIVVSLGFFLVAGDGRFAEGASNPSMVYLLRAWSWPTAQDWPLFVLLGINSGVIGYCLSQAYRLADAATVAPYEYVGLPLAVMWGWLVFGDVPSREVWIGIALILAAGLFVFLRERRKSRMRPRQPGLDARA